MGKLACSISRISHRLFIQFSEDAGEAVAGLACVKQFQRPPARSLFSAIRSDEQSRWNVETFKCLCAPLDCLRSRWLSTLHCTHARPSYLGGAFACYKCLSSSIFILLRDCSGEACLEVEVDLS